MDIHKYAEKKNKGLVEFVSIGKAFALVSKRFDPDTGTELEPEIISIDKKELQNQRDELAKQIASLDAMLSDMDKPKTPAK